MKEDEKDDPAHIYNQGNTVEKEQRRSQVPQCHTLYCDFLD